MTLGQAYQSRLPASSGGTDLTALNIFVFDGDNTGATDVVDDLEDLIEAHPGAAFYLPTGTFKFSRALDPDCSFTLTGAGQKATIIKFPKTTAAIHTTKNLTYQVANERREAVTSISVQTVPDGYAFTTDSDRFDTLGVADSSGFYEGDIVAVTSHDAHPAGGNRWLGEAMKVAYVDTGLIYLAGRLAQGSSNYATSVQVSLIRDDRAVEISHIGFTADPADGDWDDDTIDNPGSIHNHCIIIQGTPYARIHDCEFNKLWEGAIQIDYCSPLCVVENIIAHHLPNLMTQSGSGLSGRLGYVGSVGNLCFGVIFRNIIGFEARHLLTTDGHSDPSWTAAEWYKHGQPTHITFEDCVSIGAWGIPFDTHEEGSHITFKNCRAIWPGRGPQGGSYRGFGMQLRCSNAIVLGYSQSGGQYGIRIPAIARLPGNQMTLRDIDIQDLYSLGDTLITTASSSMQGLSNRASALQIDPHDGLANPPAIDVRDFRTKNVNQSIVCLGGGSVIRAGDLDFRDNGVPIELFANTDFLCDGPATFDFENTARTPSVLCCVNMWSIKNNKTASTGARAVFLEKPKIVKGDAAGKPVCFFNEADTDADKTWYAPGIVEDNPDGVASTALVSSGATTMVRASDITGAGSGGGVSAVFNYTSGRWFGPARYGSTNTATYSATGAGTIMPVCPLSVRRGGVWITALATVFVTNTATTAAHLAIYRNKGGNLGKLMATVEVTGISTAIAAATAISATLAAPVFLPEGEYFGAVLPNGGVTAIQGVSNTGPVNQIVGTSDITDPDNAGARRLELTGLTYGTPPDGPQTLTRNASTSTIPIVWFKAQ